MTLDWPRQRGRICWYDQYALNDQDAACSKYDLDRIVEELIGTGADVIAVYAADQLRIAYYPNEIWPQHPNLTGGTTSASSVLAFKRVGRR